jgi:hypothetical protein
VPRDGPVALPGVPAAQEFGRVLIAAPLRRGEITAGQPGDEPGHRLIPRSGRGADQGDSGCGAVTEMVSASVRRWVSPPHMPRGRWTSPLQSAER